MKHYTTIEQSKKLLELGLSPESADWHYHYDFDFDELETCPTFTEEDDHYVLFPQDIPCWSVGVLMELMKSTSDWSSFLTFILDTYDNKGEHLTNVWRLTFETKHYTIAQIVRKDIYKDNIIDACFEMVCYLLENGYIGKGE